MTEPYQEPLSILAISPVYWPCVGGGERLLAGILEQLAARGHKTTVLAVDAAHLPDMFVGEGSGLPRLDSHNGVEIERLNRRGGGYLGKLSRLAVRPRGAFRAAEFLTAGLAELAVAMPSPLSFVQPMLNAQADIVITANWFSGTAIMATLLARHRRIPIVGLPLLHTFQPWSRRRLLRWAAPCVDCAVALTPSEAVALKTLGSRRTEVIGGSMPETWGLSADPSSLRKRLGLGNHPVVGFVGRQDNGKGTPNLIAAMRKVWRSRPDTRLLLAGQASHRDAATAASLAALEPTERCKIVEVHDFSDSEAPSIFAACDVLAQPSEEESFGLVILESWMMRRPVIGANIPATRDIIENEYDGLIVPPRNSTALSHAIEKLLDAPKLRNLMGERGHSKVMANYTTEKMVDSWESLLSTTVQSRRARL
jgi:glycosyltransferase involved in cell wall biosynthesis